MSSREVSLSGLTFFGLTQNYKKYLHEMMVNLTMNVDGFTLRDWYEMPVSLRNYYVTIVNDISEKRKQEMLGKVRNTIHKPPTPRKREKESKATQKQKLSKSSSIMVTFKLACFGTRDRQRHPPTGPASPRSRGEMQGSWCCIFLAFHFVYYFVRV